MRICKQRKCGEKHIIPAHPQKSSWVLCLCSYVKNPQWRFIRVFRTWMIKGQLNSAMFTLFSLKNMQRIFSVLSREDSVTSTYSPERGLQFLTNTCWNGCSAPDAEGSLDEAVRGELHLTSVPLTGGPALPCKPPGSCAFTSITRESRRADEAFWCCQPQVHKVATGI